MCVVYVTIVFFGGNPFFSADHGTTNPCAVPPSSEPPRSGGSRGERRGRASRRARVHHGRALPTLIQKRGKAGTVPERRRGCARKQGAKDYTGCSWVEPSRVASGVATCRRRGWTW